MSLRNASLPNNGQPPAPLSLAGGEDMDEKALARVISYLKTGYPEIANAARRARSANLEHASELQKAASSINLILTEYESY